MNAQVAWRKGRDQNSSRVIQCVCSIDRLNPQIKADFGEISRDLAKRK